MAKISERVEGTVEKWRGDYGSPLKNFAADFIGLGMKVGLDILGKSASDKLKPLIETMEKTGEIPKELRPLLDEIKNPTGEAGAMFAQQAGGALVGGAIGMFLDGLLLPLAYAWNSATRNVVPDQRAYLATWLRGDLSDEDLDAELASLGLCKEGVRQLMKLTEIRLSPDLITRIWLRDKTAHEHLWKDLRDQGWTEDRIEVVKELAHIIPPLPDMVRFADYSAFDEKVIEQWRAQYDAPDWIKEPFALLGVTGEWADKYWFSHWKQPGGYELAEMWRRELIKEDEADLAYLTQGYSSYWRPHLLKLLKAVPTRVDVRRWWDMRTIDEARLRQIYKAQGYWDQDLEDYVLWTKVYVAFPDLIARWRNGWITLEDVKSELTTLGMPAARVEEMIQTKFKTAEPERTAGERDLTKTDIIKGVKTGVITRAEGAELLVDLGYDEDEAVYILEINIPRDEEEVVVKERELSKADILKGLKAEVITMDDARKKLAELRYSPPDVEFLLEIYQAAIKPPEEPKLREASKADIVLGVKKGLITQKEGYGMLLDIGFTPEASDFILMVKTEESPFSPINYAEFKDLTGKYRRATGKEAKPVTEEIKRAAGEVVRLTGEVEALERSIAQEKAGLVGEEVLPAAATKRLKGLQVKKHRAESELARAKSEYDSPVAEWKH
ncbi:hypothetical protein ES708_05166 [subsurface metagenome]